MSRSNTQAPVIGSNAFRSIADRCILSVFGKERIHTITHPIQYYAKKQGEHCHDPGTNDHPASRNVCHFQKGQGNFGLLLVKLNCNDS